jgi:hypothetical protein
MTPKSLKVATNKNVEEIAKLESEQVEVRTERLVSGLARRHEGRITVSITRPPAAPGIPARMTATHHLPEDMT